MARDVAAWLVWVIANAALIVVPLVGNAQTEAPTKNVLAIYGGDVQTPANAAFDRVLRQELGSHFQDRVELFAQYMDAARLGGGEHERRLANYIRESYGAGKFDLLFAMDPPSLRFLIQFRDEIATGAPVIFADIRRATLESLKLPDGFVGVPVEDGADPTVELALRLRPETRELIIVTGVAQLDRVWESRLRASAAALAPSIPVRVLSGLSVGQIEQELGKLTPLSTVLCGSFRRDGAGRIFPGALVVLERLKATTGAPIFHIVQGAVGRGAVASHSVSVESQALQATGIAKEILMGAKPGTFSLPAPIPPRPHVDWREMQRWGIDDTLLPSNSVVMFQERSWWDEYRYHAGALFMLLALETALIAGLLFERRWRRQAELDAARKGRELAHLSRVTMVGSLSTSIAHELNQPLAAILINAQAARMLIGKSSPDCNEVRQILDDIIADERRASEIITGLRGMLAKQEVSHQQIAIEDIARETLYLLRAELTNRRATVNLKVAPNCPRVMCDRVQLQQVLVNLLMNACDSMEGNAIGDRVVVVSVEPFNAGVRIRVEDEGCGITPDLAAGRFTPFATTKKHGMGLGLTVCSSIIASHRGKFYGANKSPRGAVFTVDLGGGHHGTRGIAV